MESYILVIIIFIIFFLFSINKNNLIYENYKDKFFLVQDLEDKDEALEILYKLEFTLNNIINKMCDDNKVKGSKYNDYIIEIKKKLKHVIIQESDINNKNTSYSVNKGEILVFCIRSKETKKIHNFNELLYVGIHEIAHIGCPEIGHTELFFDINEYILRKAIEYGYYNFVDYKNNKMEYCGIELTSNVLTDK